MNKIKLRVLIEKYMISESYKYQTQINSKIEYWLNRFLLLCVGSNKLFQIYKSLKNTTQSEININKSLEVYYDTNVRIDDFNPTETYEKFLTYFEMKEDYYGTSYKKEFIQIGSKLLNKVKRNLKRPKKNH